MDHRLQAYDIALIPLRFRLNQRKIDRFFRSNLIVSPKFKPMQNKRLEIKGV
jgi:hypothetical protein